MTSFFDKLKKGMEIKELPKAPESPKPEEDLPAAFTGVKTSADKKTARKEKKTKMKKDASKPSTIFQRKVVLGKKIKVKKLSLPSETAAGKEDGFEPARQSFASQNLGGPEGQLTIDVYQTDGEIVIQSAIAGIEPEDLDISIENDMVTIRGNREKVFEKEEKNYFYQECYWGRFSREIILPAETDNSRAKAEMKNGILTIRIPKTEREKKKKIVVRE